MSSINWKIKKVSHKFEAFSSENFTASLEDTEYDCLISVATSTFLGYILQTTTFQKIQKLS